MTQDAPPHHDPSSRFHVSDRLRVAMEEREISGLELAERSGVKPSFVYDILNGKSANPSGVKLAQVAETLGVSLDYLVGVARSDPHASENDEYPLIALLPHPTSQAAEPVRFHRDWLRTRLHAGPHQLRLWVMQGDHMLPTLFPGDMLLIDITEREPTPPGLFLMTEHAGEHAADTPLRPSIRRIERIPETNPPMLRLSSDNPHYATHDVQASRITLLGRLVWFAREV